MTSSEHVPADTDSTGQTLVAPAPIGTGPNWGPKDSTSGDAKGGLGARLIEKALGQKPDILIPELGRKMMDAVNLGVPATKHVPALRRHLHALVREVGGVSPARAGGSILKRMFGG